MKRIIREQLADGSHAGRHHPLLREPLRPRVRAHLPFEGFNLFLYGWIGASTARRRERVVPARPAPEGTSGGGAASHRGTR
jgi:hypothetical protein